MSAINPDILARLYPAIEVLRDALPVVTRGAEILFPAEIPVIEGVSFGLGKLFELLVQLESHPVQVVTDAEVQQETLAQWKADGKLVP